jgi:ubiquinone/menaquinone biosynthesis C-methylase UbiE
MQLETAERFSGRVESYRRHRPRYPDAVVELLKHECDLNDDSVIADIAAGTGLLTEKFLEGGFDVVAVEPNEEMRAACETLTKRFPKLGCVSGSAEATGLSPRSFELITVAQAMHWFDLERTRNEFARILKINGWCAVVYNERRMSGDDFHDGYEKLLRDFGIDYAKVQRQHLTSEKIAGFFAASPMKRVVFPNAQLLTLDALEGRIHSSSYMPRPEHPRYAAMCAAIAELFESHQQDGYVRLEYDCTVSYGQL